MAASASTISNADYLNIKVIVFFQKKLLNLDTHCCVTISLYFKEVVSLL